jgi:GntR family transcriptional regulator/MocR family aminotransferase
MRQIYQSRATVLRDALEERLSRFLDVPPAVAGMHLLAWLPEGFDDRVVSERAAHHGVLVPPLSHFRQTPSRRGGLVLGFGGSPVPRLLESVERLSRAFE